MPRQKKKTTRGRPQKVAKGQVAATASPVSLQTIEDAVAWSIGQRTRPTPASPDEALNRWCEYLFAMTPEQMRALTLVQAERFLQSTTIDEGTRAFMSITDSFRAGSAILGKMLDAAVAQREQQLPVVKHVPDEEVLKGLRLAAEELAGEKHEEQVGADVAVEDDDIILPMEGVG